MNALGDVKIGAVIKSENRLHDRDALWIVVEGRRGQDRHERAYLGATGEGQATRTAWPCRLRTCGCTRACSGTVLVCAKALVG